MGRRYRKVVEEGGVTNYNYWIYDGYNAIAKYTRSAGASEASLAKTYYWGKDLGGGEGTGGLLAELLHSSNSQLPTSSFPLFDGNGNITDYVDSTGAVVAHYQYDSFGKVLASSGAKKDEMDYGFSTRVNDRDLGLSYYNFRYYDANQGRWLGRDPIEERGGVNLYGFGPNSPLNGFDVYGNGWVGDAWDWWYDTVNDVADETGVTEVADSIREYIQAWNKPQGLSFNFSQTLDVGGCVFVGGASICLTGGYTVNIGKCCDDGEIKNYSVIDGTIALKVGVQKGRFHFFYAKAGSAPTLSKCPSERSPKVTGSIGFQAGVGFATGGCHYTFGKGWKCSGGFGVRISGKKGKLATKFGIVAVGRLNFKGKYQL